MRGKPKGSKKTGGRKKGSLNKVSADLVQTLIDLGHEPAAVHVKLFNEAWKSYLVKKKNKNHWGAGPMLDVAVKANAELMKYMYPQKKSVEHSGPDGGPMQVKTYHDLVNLLGGEAEDESDEPPSES